MASLFKKGKCRIRIIIDTDMLLMVEKGIRGEICHAIHRYAKANNKYTKDYNKSTTSSYLVYHTSVSKIACKGF